LGRGNLNAIRSVISQHEQLLETGSSNYYPDELDDANALLEGQKKKVFVNAFERNPEARSRCIEHYGAICAVCQFDFEKTFGEIGKGFIHVHHLVPLASLKKEYEVDPIEDLRPVCPNYHAMLHKRNPPFEIEQLQEIAHNRMQSDKVPTTRGVI
jgi:5-methylcytosine-specific restriction protein A